MERRALGKTGITVPRVGFGASGLGHVFEDGAVDAVGAVRAALEAGTPSTAVVAAYKGMNAAGGPKGVGDAVNESVVITFVLLFIVNFVISAIYLQVVPPKTG